MPYGGVIFDLDGTLVDTLTDIGEAINALLVQDGYSEHTMDVYYELVGQCHQIKDFISRAFGFFEKASSDRQDRLLQRFRSAHEKNWQNKSRPYPGVVDLLYHLHQNGVKTAVLSNKLHVFAVRTVSHFLPEFEFVRVQGARPDRPMKPDPHFAMEIAADMGVAPNQIAFLGDSQDDMRTACNAGMTAVGAAWGYTAERDLWESGAQYVIHEPSEILRIE